MDPAEEVGSLVQGEGVGLGEEGQCLTEGCGSGSGPLWRRGRKMVPLDGGHNEVKEGLELDTQSPRQKKKKKSLVFQKVICEGTSLVVQQRTPCFQFRGPARATPGQGARAHIL